MDYKYGHVYKVMLDCDIDDNIQGIIADAIWDVLQEKKERFHVWVECESVCPLPEDEVIDEVGGVHGSGVGYNQYGEFCGECSRTTCKGCTENCVHANEVNNT